MNSLSIAQLLCALKDATLSTKKIARLRAWVGAIRHPGECLALIEAAETGCGCPRCGASHVHRCRNAIGLERFRCLACRRTYNALTGTPLARLRKRGRCLTYLHCVLDSSPVRVAAKTTGVHRTTSFRWRHRFLPGAIYERSVSLSAFVKVDETCLLESQKGSRHLTRPARHRGGVAPHRGIGAFPVCLLIARDRSGNTLDFLTGRGLVSATQLVTCLGSVLPPNVLLISDGAASYRRFVQAAGLTHEWLNVRAGIRARGDIHIQNVNGWHARFKNWMMGFHSVASR